MNEEEEEEQKQFVTLQSAGGDWKKPECLCVCVMRERVSLARELNVRYVWKPI